MTDDIQAHIPVMVNEVVAALEPRDGGLYVDGTFGRGGYSRAILDAAECRVLGIDRDPAAVAAGRDLARAFPDRLSVVEGVFGDLDDILDARGIDAVDGIALDLGVSSPQVDDPSRGFSFRFDGPLDMRMGSHGPTAAEVVNTLPEKELASIIWRLGEERFSRRVARAIVAARAEGPIERTPDLADIVRRVVPRSRDGIDPATRTFQALRLYVNDELGELDRGLRAAERALRPGGRLVVVSFHSLEDRRVKEFLRVRSGRSGAPSRHLPVAGPDAGRGPTPSFRLTVAKPATPDAAERAANPRARSARLRAAERTEASSFEEAA